MTRFSTRRTSSKMITLSASLKSRPLSTSALSGSSARKKRVEPGEVPPDLQVAEILLGVLGHGRGNRLGFGITPAQVQQLDIARKTAMM